MQPVYRIFKYTVPVDDKDHVVELQPGAIPFGVWGNTREVHFYAYYQDPEDGAGELPTEARHFRVYGTGQPFGRGMAWHGTAVVPGIPFVWHLMEAR